MKLSDIQLQKIEEARVILDRFGLVLMNAECRTGKTRMGLSLCSGKVLFVTKKQAIGSVLSDLEDFCDLECQVINQESLHKVEKASFDFVVIDECHSGFSKFPKTSARWKTMKKLVGRSKVIFMSATPAIESTCQFYHIFKLSCNSPFKNYPTFYKFHFDFGVKATIRIAGGQTVQDYSKGKDNEILDAVNPYIVNLSQEEVGFDQKTQIITHKLENPDLIYLSKCFKKDKVLEIDNHTVLGDTPAALNQKLHMLEGGTLKDMNGETFILPVDYNPTYKCEYIRGKLRDGKKLAIFTQYIAERQMIFDFFKDKITTDMDEFKETDVQLWVGSIQSYSEGFDLSWLDGAMCLYSLNYRGSTFLQVINRMANYKRKDPIKVHILLHGFDHYVFEAVSKKQSFDFLQG